MDKIVDMWGHELHVGDYIHGINTMSKSDLGCPCVCGYRVTGLNEDGSINVEGSMDGVKGRFRKPYKMVSRADLRYYSLEELGYERLCFASSAYFLKGDGDGEDHDERDL